jgi:hypothetical protein
MNSSSSVKIIDPDHPLVNTAGRVTSAGQYHQGGQDLVDVLMDETAEVETFRVDQVQLLGI